MVQSGSPRAGPFRRLRHRQADPDLGLRLRIRRPLLRSADDPRRRRVLRGRFATFGRIDVHLAAFVPLDPAAIALLMVDTNSTYGDPCLAVADGIVTLVFAATPTGGTVAANEVRIDHVSGKEQGAVAIAYIIALLTGSMPPLTLRYTTRYVHLDGPSRISVSAGMYVKLGKRLGVTDDTGTSVSHHLHFALFDNLINFTVRPMPMDGQSLSRRSFPRRRSRSFATMACLLPARRGARW